MGTEADSDPAAAPANTDPTEPTLTDNTATLPPFRRCDRPDGTTRALKVGGDCVGMGTVFEVTERLVGKHNMNNVLISEIENDLRQLTLDRNRPKTRGDRRRYRTKDGTPVLRRPLRLRVPIASPTLSWASVSAATTHGLRYSTPSYSTWRHRSLQRSSLSTSVAS